LAVIVPAERAEEARAVMVELFPAGFEERELGAVVELAAYAGGESEALLREAFGSVRVDEVEPGWEERWRDFHRGVRVGELWVGPPWEKPPAGARAVVIDPGQAFGTGSHPTTRLCLELLADLPCSSLLDVGCGSGVLAIAAAKLGFSPVRAIDSDLLAVAATAANARLNGVEVEVAELDALAGELPDADIVLANLTLASVSALIARIQGVTLVTSGYLATDRIDAVGFECVRRAVLRLGGRPRRPVPGGVVPVATFRQLPGLQGLPRRRARRARASARGRS
jgi:ribosomal protein L11 methyltransferase